jgi:hypothetical protein
VTLNAPRPVATAPPIAATEPRPHHASAAGGTGQAPGSVGFMAAGASASAAGSSSTVFFFAVLLALAAVSALFFERLRSASASRPSAVFLALLERPG